MTAVTAEGNEVPLWVPSKERIAGHPMTQFRAAASARAGRELADYDALHRWSVEDLAAFWDLVWDFCGVVGDKGARRLVDGDRMPGAHFFPDATLNFTDNLLKRRGEGDALVFWGEDRVKRRMSWDALSALVSQLEQAFRAAGVQPGDRIAAMMPNLPETIAGMLAAAAIGAVWSSCSPDFGPRGVLDRFGQIEPVVFIACDGYYYGGKVIDIGAKLAEIVPALPTVRQVIIVPYIGTAEATASSLPHGATLEAAIAPFAPRQVETVALPFNHPLYIMFSSGTTGIPKCIVHGAGGTLLQHLKEIYLHCGIGADDRLFYFTTCGWMMWNWLASGLATGATLLLYDGSPFHPDGNILFDYASAEGMAMFGTSAKFIDSVHKAGLKPLETHDLSALRVITSTGSPLSPESFAFVYDGIKRDVHLASISGGTDIVSCFVLGIPDKPVWKGEIQGPGLGLAMDVWSEEGAHLESGKGELVCLKPFPSMPIGFWNDPDGERYHAAYFARFDNVWCHGDFAEWTVHGGLIIHGRSDATLNPGGVRIGTAEIYNQVEQIPEVLEALAIGQDWDDDVRVVLFVRLRPGTALGEALEKTIRLKIRTGCTPRHVPARIVAVADIPRTKSGKIVELAVREVVHGRPVKNQEALANPEALTLFRDLPQLAV
ncbi:acetoacetate--CoA ligase [Mesorhizobium sp. BR1-1-16]|uniref:acetoacetate--CoA ligase n=1 Tax=Mesorhizobium sp. BR1-1-16 TaxID=2876653 RepID=UPI001CCB154E|nr:acetoacetate--CoA ligase [Mesorhizobium sp. BR1-1-16]MBZ9936124.1 acetoacetate--CoA ligase [Mesorhizobium sp. BR1-1-16]